MAYTAAVFIRRCRLAVVALLGVSLSACATNERATSDVALTEPDLGSTPAAAAATALQAFVGVPFAYDAPQSSPTFASLRRRSVTFRVTFAPSANGLTATAGRITGTPLVTGTFSATISASDGTRLPTSEVVTIVVSAAPTVNLTSANLAQAATVSRPFTYDATKGGTAFSGAGLTYTVSFSPTANGLSAVNGRIDGVPAAAGTTVATVVARDAGGRTASNAFSIVAFSADLTAPVTPATNRTTDAGAALGRVLFYDRRLSVNDRVSCASCHQQQFAFGDTARLSRGFAGGSTGRHSMGLQNARFYQRGRFFWDERAATLEAQVLLPIQDGTEMGMTLDGLVTKLSLSSFYAPLFQSAFGSPEVTTDRVSRALAQFVRSLTSGTSKFDQAFVGGTANFNAVFTADELRGQQLFNGPAGCARCHATNAHVSDNVHNTGLDAVSTDLGAGLGRFKSPSLRNVAARARFMHDGRMTSLEQVVEFYNSGVQANANLDGRLRSPGGQPQRLNLRTDDKAALVAYLRTLTDPAFLAAAKFADPFAR